MILQTDLKYVLDSDTFIKAARTHYSIDFAMPFWDGLVHFAEKSLICSIDKVHDELLKGNDELSKWAKKTFLPYFFNTDSNEILTQYATIINWAQRQSQYEQRAKDEFYEMDNADPWLISFALTNGLTIVTHEVLNKEIKRKIPIPNVCEAFNIKCIDIYQMLRALNFRF